MIGPERLTRCITIENVLFVFCNPPGLIRMHDQPPIRTVRTQDGVAIPYYVHGEGPTVVWSSPIAATVLEREWQVGWLRDEQEAAARYVRLVRFAGRGFAGAGRAPGRYTLEHFGLDILAVADAVHADSFGLIGMFQATGAAVRLAIDYPSRVRALALMNPFEDSGEVSRTPREQGFAVIERLDAEQSAEMRAKLILPHDAERHDQEAFVQMITEAARRLDPEALQAARSWSVKGLLPLITQPVLVELANRLAVQPAEYTQRVVGAIAGAQFVSVPGCEMAPMFEFLAGHLKTPARADILARLSGREHEVLNLLSTGSTNNEIASVLGISGATVARHVHNIFEKLEVTNRTAAAACLRDDRRMPVHHSV